MRLARTVNYVLAMKKLETKKPFRLSTETVRQLEQRELAAAAGGDIPICPPPKTSNCPW